MDRSPQSEKIIKCIGIFAEHSEFVLKAPLMKILREARYEVVDFGNFQLMPDDDSPDVIVSLAQAIASGDISCGIAFCGSAAKACMAANKIPGVRASLINEGASARYAAEDGINMICLDDQVTDLRLAWELIATFLNVQFKEARGVQMAEQNSM